MSGLKVLENNCTSEQSHVPNSPDHSRPPTTVHHISFQCCLCFFSTRCLGFLFSSSNRTGPFLNFAKDNQSLILQSQHSHIHTTSSNLSSSVTSSSCPLTISAWAANLLHSISPVLSCSCDHDRPVVIFIALRSAIVQQTFSSSPST